MRKVLNVGGNNKAIPLPPEYTGWEHVLLDIDPKNNPDVVCDARELSTLPSLTYDSIYCSHNLEHYYRHDVARVLAGFSHVLKADGFVFIRVPDMGQVMRTVVENNLDIDDVVYQSPAGPITVRDIIYGYDLEIEQSSNDFFAHKTGFTQQSLTQILNLAGFQWLFAGTGNFEITALGFRNKPNEYAEKLFNLSGHK